MTVPYGKKRVLIGAGSYLDAAAAFRVAERIASGLIAELGGLFVDDEAIAEAAARPDQRVVTAGGDVVPAPTRQRYLALLESDARAFRTGLAGVARSCTVEWAFERRSGDLISGVCEAARGWDLLLVGHRSAPRRAGRVVLVSRAEAPSPEAADLARRVAAAFGTEVSKILVSTPPHVLERLQNGVALATSEQDMLARVNRINSALVVIDLAEGLPNGPEQLRRLIEVARCPVLALNAAGAGSSLLQPSADPA